MAGTQRTQSAESGYVIRPNFQKKFRAPVVKQCIHEVLLEELGDKEYNAKEVPNLTKVVSEAIKQRLKSLELERYKFIVQVVIGELRGEGAKVLCSVLQQLSEYFITETSFDSSGEIGLVKTDANSGIIMHRIVF